MEKYKFKLYFWNDEGEMIINDVKLNDFISFNSNEDLFLKILDYETGTLIETKYYHSTSKKTRTIEQMFFNEDLKQFFENEKSNFNIDYSRKLAGVFSFEKKTNEFNQINNIKPKNMTDEKLKKGVELQHQICEMKDALEHLKSKTRTQIQFLKISTELGEYCMNSSKNTSSLRNNPIELNETDSNKIKNVLIEIHEEKIKKLEKEYKAL